MTESAIEKVTRLAAQAASKSSLNKILSLARTTDNNDDDVDVHPMSEAAEANDNEEMLRTGVHMNASGHASYGSVNLGHVRPHKSGGYVGMHPSGLVTGKHPTRAKAAMALLNLHQYVPKDAKKQVKHLNLSGSSLDQVISLAGQPRTYDTETRQKYASQGVALPDGSFPIPDRDALEDAIRDYGRAKDQAKAKAHIIKRAKALGATDSLPEDWK
jgi:hypothetical protein